MQLVHDLMKLITQDYKTMSDQNSRLNIKNIHAGTLIALIVSIIIE